MPWPGAQVWFCALQSRVLDLLVQQVLPLDGFRARSADMWNLMMGWWGYMGLHFSLANEWWVLWAITGSFSLAPKTLQGWAGEHDWLRRRLIREVVFWCQLSKKDCFKIRCQHWSSWWSIMIHIDPLWVQRNTVTKGIDAWDLGRWLQEPFTFQPIRDDCFLTLHLANF